MDRASHSDPESAAFSREPILNGMIPRARNNIPISTHRAKLKEQTQSYRGLAITMPESNYI